MPTLPELIIRLPAGVIVKSPEELEIVELVQATDNFAVGAVVPIPTLPLLARYNVEDNPVSPPTDLWKFKVPLFNKLKVAAGALPVGTTKDRLDEIVAVGFPPAMFRKPNFAEEVAVPPIRRSNVLLFGLNTPLVESRVQLELPSLPGAACHVPTPEEFAVKTQPAVVEVPN